MTIAQFALRWQLRDTTYGRKVSTPYKNHTLDKRLALIIRTSLPASISSLLMVFLDTSAKRAVARMLFSSIRQRRISLRVLLSNLFVNQSLNYNVNIIQNDGFSSVWLKKLGVFCYANLTDKFKTS